MKEQPVTIKDYERGQYYPLQWIAKCVHRSIYFCHMLVAQGHIPPCQFKGPGRLGVRLYTPGQAKALLVAIRGYNKGELKKTDIRMYLDVHWND